ncbi:MAG TPA: hypothetical protein EYH34_03425, partial [Planctomycetes bacterium]|nr:hypothetical protein [Planctomycetota bacterium]
YARTAFITLGQAKIEKEILGATPSWKNGLEALQQFIDQHRDEPYFPELRDTLTKYAKAIALGALKTAAATKRRDLLQVSDNAVLIFDRYAPTDPPPTEVHAQIRAERERAEATILKWETLQAALKDMKAALEAKRPLDALVARRQLLSRYPDLVSDRQVVQFLQQTLDTARDLVKKDDLNQATQTDERPEAVAPALTLATQTRALSTDRSDGQTVFVLAKGCLFGVDRVTGTPVWRRVIGVDSPFFPVKTQTSQAAALLAYDTRFGELILVERRTGKLLWRQALGEAAVGPPVIVEGQVYQAARGGHVYKLELETGRIAARLTFSQDVHGPPVLVGSTHLILAGDEALLYSVSLRPFGCQSVSLLGHKPGSLVAPLLAMGSLILVSENISVDRCLLRVVDASRPEERLVEIEKARVTLDGQARDAAALRGNVLFVPTTGERVAAFSVSDDPNQPPLTLIGRHTVKTPHPGRMFLTAGPDGQMWMAGSALRRFQLKTNSISLDPNLVASGLTTQPLQAYGPYLFVARRRPHSTAIWFVKIDREARPTMTSLWRTVLGARLLTVTASGSDTLLCLTEEGYLFHVGRNELTQGGFRIRADAHIQYPEDLAEPVRAVILPDGQIAVTCGNPEPVLWLINAQGQVRREIPLDQPLQADPIALGRGLVLPFAGKLGYQGTQTRRSRVEGYTAPVKDQEKAPRWVGGASVGDTEMIIADSEGTVLKIQYRTSPQPHLFAAATWSAGAPIDVPPTAHRDWIVVADSARRLRLLHRSNFEPLGEVHLPAAASGRLYVVEDRLLVEAGHEQLLCYQLGRELQRLWALPLKGTGLADRPLLVEGRMVLAERSGRVCQLDPQTGQVTAETMI